MVAREKEEGEGIVREFGENGYMYLYDWVPSLFT